MNDAFRPAREPMLNLPGSVAGLVGAFVLIHLVRTELLSPESDLEVLLLFAFIPVRYTPELLNGFVFPGGVGADAWTFVTYAALHGGWMHLLINGLWLIAFGSALARRFGTARFLAFSAICAAAGAALHLATHVGDQAPVVGASAAISGQMAGAARFVFEHGGPLGALRGRGGWAYSQRAATLGEVFSNPAALGFLAAWFGLNLLIGLASIPIAGDAGSVAWQAHIGGFVAGLLLFPLFDPVPRR
jgi:membrane associated rhomboid family serine protease